MDPAGSLLAKITGCVADIDLGRKCFTINGREHEGRIFYEEGISTASKAFNGALAAADPQTLIQSDYTYSEQELQFCDEADKDTKSSLTKALQSFKDVLRSLEVVKEDAAYKNADKTYPADADYRIKGCPKDSFHIACIARITRLRNSLRTPGVNIAEKAVINQRIANMHAAQGSYLELQQKALEP